MIMSKRSTVPSSKLISIPSSSPPELIRGAEEDVLVLLIEVTSYSRAEPLLAMVPKTLGEASLDELPSSDLGFHSQCQNDCTGFRSRALLTSHHISAVIKQLVEQTIESLKGK
jgi:hypothetical protein